MAQDLSPQVDGKTIKWKDCDEVFSGWPVVPIGFAVGLIPCPSALAALSTALASHDLSATILIISMFSLGIFLSLTMAGSFIAKYSTKFLANSFAQNRPNLASQIQIFVFVATGLWHISMFRA